MSVFFHKSLHHSKIWAMGPSQLHSIYLITMLRSSKWLELFFYVRKTERLYFFFWILYFTNFPEGSYWLFFHQTQAKNVWVIKQLEAFAPDCSKGKSLANSNQHALLLNFMAFHFPHHFDSPQNSWDGVIQPDLNESETFFTCFYWNSFFSKSAAIFIPLCRLV